MVLDALPPSLPETSISVVSLPSVCDEGVRINLIYLLIPAILFGCLITTRLCEYIPQPSPYTPYSIPHTHIFTSSPNIINMACRVVSIAFLQNEKPR